MTYWMALFGTRKRPTAWFFLVGACEGDRCVVIPHLGGADGLEYVGTCERCVSACFWICMN